LRWHCHNNFKTYRFRIKKQGDIEMNILLWIFQILLAFVYIYHAWLMWFLPAAARQGGQMAYIEAIPSGLRRFTAVAESLAGVGLILPWSTGILPWLTPLAAVGLVLIMVGAVVFHLPARNIRILSST